MINEAMEMAVAEETQQQVNSTNIRIEVLLGGEMDMEEAADALLESAGAIGREHGIYTDRQLFRKMRDEHERIPAIDEHAVSPDVENYLFDMQLEELIDLANLTPLQEICLRLRAGGLSLTKIAKFLGINGNTMAAHLRIAQRRVRSASREGKYAGWYEVYLSEIRRAGYRGH